MAQQQVQKQKSQVKDSHTEDTTASVTNEELAEAAEAALDKIDDVLADQDDEDLLADMDGLLEVDAEQFVRDYVQVGGE